MRDEHLSDTTEAFREEERRARNEARADELIRRDWADEWDNLPDAPELVDMEDAHAECERQKGRI